MKEGEKIIIFLVVVMIVLLIRMTFYFFKESDDFKKNNLKEAIERRLEEDKKSIDEEDFTNKIPEDFENKIAELSNENINQTQGIVYNNSHYGFSLTFPQTWSGYTTQNRTLNWGSFGTADSVDFGFSIQDSLFNVGVYTKNQWQQIKSEEVPTPTYLGENSQYVFGYAVAQDAPNDTIIARMKEIRDIVKTFKVSK